MNDWPKIFNDVATSISKREYGKWKALSGALESDGIVITANSLTGMASGRSKCGNPDLAVWMWERYKVIDQPQDSPELVPGIMCREPY